MSLQAAITAIEYLLPDRTLTSAQLAAEFPEWCVEKIEEKTGIANRHIAADGECASDLAVRAAQRLFESGAAQPAEIDFLLLCTQSPDYFLPTTACLLQHRLGLPTSCGALDFNLGSSGYVYGLGLAKGLIETGQAHKVLLITADTYSKYVHPADRSVRTIFGDAAAATLVEGVPAEGVASIGPFVWGTDGKGAQNLVVPAGGLRLPSSAETLREETDENGNKRTRCHLFMDGAEIFAFTLRAVPHAVNELLTRSGTAIESVDLFVFHQANQYILEHLRKRLRISSERFIVHLRECGNTASPTIPIALKAAVTGGRLRAGQTVALVGFGGGYSWGAALVRWHPFFR